VWFSENLIEQSARLGMVCSWLHLAYPCNFRQLNRKQWFVNRYATRSCANGVWNCKGSAPGSCDSDLSKCAASVKSHNYFAGEPNSYSPRVSASSTALLLHSTSLHRRACSTAETSISDLPHCTHWRASCSFAYRALDPIPSGLY